MIEQEMKTKVIKEKTIYVGARVMMLARKMDYGPGIYQYETDTGKKKYASKHRPILGIIQRTAVLVTDETIFNDGDTVLAKRAYTNPFIITKRNTTKQNYNTCYLAIGASNITEPALPVMSELFLSALAEELSSSKGPVSVVVMHTLTVIDGVSSITPMVSENGYLKCMTKATYNNLNL